MKMKNITLALAGVMAAAAFAPEASALPLFARQTGMACSACHFQHFPLLNSFGRSFKASGYTLMGAQEKVEGDNLSIPSTLNMAVLTTAGYTKTNATSVANTHGQNSDANGTVYVPGTNGEFSLFIGGKVSDFAGALAEVGLLGNTGSVGGNTVGVTSAKLPMLWAVGDAHVGIVPFTTAGQGASYGYEVLNTGANAIHTMMFVGGDFAGFVPGVLSAQQYIGTATAATGAAIVANNSMGFINVSKFHMAGPADLAGTGGNAGGSVTGAKLSSTYIRVAGTFDLAGFDSAVGIQNWSGASMNGAAVTGGMATQSVYDTKATAIDGQMQGELGGMPVGFYASYATAPASTTGLGNAYNLGGTNNKKSFNIGAELGVLPEKATVGAALRNGNNGAATNSNDNAYLLNATYKLAQNMMLNLTYVANSGSAWNASSATGSKETIINLATIF